MWKTVILLRAATFFFPQAGGVVFNRIQQAMLKEIFATVFHSRFFQQAKILWKIFS